MAGSQAGLEKVTENDGYMEPYEAQKMMAGKAEGYVEGPLFVLLLCKLGERWTLIRSPFQCWVLWTRQTWAVAVVRGQIVTASAVCDGLAVARALAKATQAMKAP